MWLGPEASFGGAGARLRAGACCVGCGVRKAPRFLPLGLTPLAFSAQQAAEGGVWLGLRHDDPSQVARMAVVYLFFAFAFWPFWIPFSLVFLERRRKTRWLLVGMAGLRPVWLWLYAPLAFDPSRWLSAEVMHHSIAYLVNELPVFQLVPRTTWRAAYLVFICLPLVIARPGADAGTWNLLYGVGLVAGLFAFSYLFYWYAFTSIWCFFAALLSLLVAFVFARLPEESRQ